VVKAHALRRAKPPRRGYLVDDQYNAERYHYMGVYKPAVLTPNWLGDTTGVPRNYPGWGAAVKNLLNAYLLIFADRLLVTGSGFRRCKDAASVLEAVKELI